MVVVLWMAVVEYKIEESLMNAILVIGYGYR